MFKAEMLSENAGTEASFKSLDGKGKRIIHIATHGFYFDNSIKDIAYIERMSSVSKYSFDDRAMFRSGLLFSGADCAWYGEINTEDIDDGILTSQEISNLDLTGLDMVVLSACDTAQGEVNSEGVFGLQRGFKKAGANSVLMSLWKVDDLATEQFMTSFYYHWIKGKSKIDALRSAQKHLLSIPRYSEPKYWAGFVLLDAVN
jgi:CHAT domain-containing protein